MRGELTALVWCNACAHYLLMRNVSRLITLIMKRVTEEMRVDAAFLLFIEFARGGFPSAPEVLGWKLLRSYGRVYALGAL